MGTRSAIGIKHGDVVKAVYCHWDGYLSHNGEILRDHYSDPFKLAELIAIGDLSSLAPSIDKPAGHDFNKPVEGYTVFYARDRGEELVVNKFKDFEDYKANHQYEEYEYILRPAGGWYVSQYGGPYISLEEAFELEAESH